MPRLTPLSSTADLATAVSTTPLSIAVPTPMAATPTPMVSTTTARGRLRLSPSPTSTAVSTTPLSTAVPTPMAATPTLMVSTTTARGRLRPSPTMATGATMAATAPTGIAASGPMVAMAMAAMDTTVEKVTTWTTDFDNYISRPKTITTKNLFQQNLHHKTGHYCQTKTKKHVKVQTATLIVSPSSIKC